MFYGKIKRWLRKKEGLIIEFLGVVFSAIILIVALSLYFLGLLDILTLLGVVFSLLLAFLPIYFYLLKKRDQTILISFTSK